MQDHNENQVDCWLLTGATGLVGRFILAEILRAGQLVAVIVRDKSTCSSAARIEEALANFEEIVQLRRPKVLAGDLTRQGLGLSEPDARWLSDKRIGVIHSAASIRFNADSPQAEPYLSNVVGTENLLSLLQSYRVVAFLHVSSAYVTSRATVDSRPLFSGNRPELALVRNAEGGNDYESSKIMAEQLILDCNWVGKRTICRPSIVVGDSQTGYSSTFHGFYAPLKIGAEYANAFGFSEDAGAWFLSQLGLKESDQKNFVPVDWVARAIVHIALTSALHGFIYHLTNPEPTSCGAIQTAIVRSLQKLAGHQPHAHLPHSATEQFRELLGVYESYFNSDPIFECKNTTSALPDLPCPKVDVQTLEMLGDYAIRVNFGWPRPAASVPDYAKTIQNIISSPRVAAPVGRDIFELRLLGPAAPDVVQFVHMPSGWQLIDQRVQAKIAYQLTVRALDFADCINGTSDIGDLINLGRAVFQGNLASDRLAFLNDWLQDVKLLSKI